MVSHSNCSYSQFGSNVLKRYLSSEMWIVALISIHYPPSVVPVIASVTLAMNLSFDYIYSTVSRIITALSTGKAFFICGRNFFINMVDPVWFSFGSCSLSVSTGDKRLSNCCYGRNSFVLEFLLIFGGMLYWF